MTDFSQCWRQHTNGDGACSPIRPELLLITRTEAARILSLSEREIDRLRYAGKLMAKKHESKVLFPLSELERYAESVPWEVDLHS